MSEKLPWFPFYPKDFMSDDKVISMSAMECGAYIRLLCVAWNSHPIGTLLASDKTLARIATLSDEEWSQHKDAIMAPFTLVDCKWHQKRMVQDGIACIEKHKNFVESGERGARKRWGNRHPIGTPSRAHKGANGSPNGPPNSNQIQNQNKEESLIFPLDIASEPVISKVNGNGNHERLDDLKCRIGRWFRRRKPGEWDAKETRKLKEQEKKLDPETLELLERFYTANIPKEDDFRRTSIYRLLDNLSIEVDKARRHRGSRDSLFHRGVLPISSPLPVENAEPADPAAFSAFLEAKNKLATSCRK